MQVIEPIKPGDDLFPCDIVIVDGVEQATLKTDWTQQKQVALDIRTIDYLLQFPENHGSKSLINMIRGDAERARRFGSEAQKARFRDLMALRQSWLDAISGGQRNAMSRILKNVLATVKRLSQSGFLTEASKSEFETLCDSRRQPKK